MDEILKPSVSGTFYPDSFGTLVKVNAVNLTVYGYMTLLYMTDEGEPERRIFTENNRWVTLPFAEKVSIDNGSSRIDASLITAS